MESWLDGLAPSGHVSALSVDLELREQLFALGFEVVEADLFVVEGRVKLGELREEGFLVDLLDDGDGSVGLVAWLLVGRNVLIQPPLALGVRLLLLGSLALATVGGLSTLRH